jgi:CheY-like chemotaxis protein
MRTLLLADESTTVQRVIALTFADQKIRVVSVPDGQQAMEKMAAQRPDIVLAGTTLPHVSGYDLARFMRSKPELKDVPVLLLSGAFEAVDDARFASSGANGILEKPVEPSVVIGRVKELLGLKSDEKPATDAGRMLTPAGGPAEKKAPVSTPPRAVTSTRGTPSNWEQLREQTGLDRHTKSVEDSAKRGDYLDTLDAAFDTLDQHLAGRVPASKTPRNPAGPLGQGASTADPRSPGPRQGAAPPAAGNPVYEVDDDWFGDSESKARAAAKAGRREIEEDLSDPSLVPPAAPKTTPQVFEVDEEWFAEGDKARAAHAAEQKQLAAEMGIYEVDLGEAPKPAAPPSDFDFSAEDLKRLATEPDPSPAASSESPAAAAQSVAVPPAAPSPAAPAAPPVAPVVAAPTVTPVVASPTVAPAVVERPAPAPAAGVVPSMPTAIAPMPPPIATADHAPVVHHAPVAGQAPSAPAPAQAPKLADDFDALLAFEQGERKLPPMPPPPEIKIVTPEITPAMLDQIAARVADRLTASVFGEQLRDAMTATMRETVNQTVSATVRPVVSETSERVVREVVAQTMEGVVREVVSTAAERAVRDVVSETTERVVREVVPGTAERSVRDAVSHATDRAVPEAVSQTTERVVREVVPGATERVVREVVPEATERVVREVVPEATERVVREVVPATAERVVREVVGETADRAVREVVSETSERLVREEIERIKSKRQ